MTFILNVLKSIYFYVLVLKHPVNKRSCLLQIKVYNTIAGYRSDKVSLNKVIRALRVRSPRRQKAGKIMASVFLRFYDYRVALVAVVSTNIFYVPGKGIFMVLKFVINCKGTFFVRANLLHQINVIKFYYVTQVLICGGPNQ